MWRKLRDRIFGEPTVAVYNKVSEPHQTYTMRHGDKVTLVATEADAGIKGITIRLDGPHSITLLPPP